MVYERVTQLISGFTVDLLHSLLELSAGALGISEGFNVFAVFPHSIIHIVDDGGRFKHTLGYASRVAELLANITISHGEGVTADNTSGGRADSHRGVTCVTIQQGNEALVVLTYDLKLLVDLGLNEDPSTLIQITLLDDG